MTDTPNPIEPALTPEEWADVFTDESGELSTSPSPGLVYEMAYLWGRERPHAAIAICNAALPDSDPRKITRENVRTLRQAAVALETDQAAFNVDNTSYAAMCRQLAGVLESYLPPETP